MKKLILAMVFVFATGTMMNANSSNEEIITPTTKAIEIVEDFGCASDCVRSAREDAQFIAFMMNVGDVDAFKILYANCYYTNCA